MKPDCAAQWYSLIIRYHIIPGEPWLNFEWDDMRLLGLGYEKVFGEDGGKETRKKLACWSVVMMRGLFLLTLRGILDTKLQFIYNASRQFGCRFRTFVAEKTSRLISFRYLLLGQSHRFDLSWKVPHSPCVIQIRMQSNFSSQVRTSKK